MSQPLELKEEKFTLTFQDHPAPVLVITGTVSVPSPQRVLGPFLDKVHRAVLDSGAKEIQIDIRPLEFINSSAIRPLVDWVWWVRDLPAARQYKLRFLNDTQRVWQKRFLSAMSYFASNVMTFDG